MAIYDLSKPLHREGFKLRCNTLYNKQKIVELVEKKPKRTLEQNSYLHLILRRFAKETCCELDYVKDTYYKRFCNPELFIVRRWDELINEYTETLRHSNELTTEEMSISIDRFKKWAAENGVYIPDADKTDEIIEAWNEVNTYTAKVFL